MGIPATFESHELAHSPLRRNIVRCESHVGHEGKTEREFVTRTLHISSTSIMQNAMKLSRYVIKITDELT